MTYTFLSSINSKPSSKEGQTGSPANFCTLISISNQPVSTDQLIFRYHPTTTSYHDCYYYKHQKLPIKFHTSTPLILHVSYLPKLSSNSFFSLLTSPNPK